jgi:low affinity Fe/Cu permease
MALVSTLSTLNTSITPIQSPTTQVPDIATPVAQAIEDLVNSVVDAANKSGSDYGQLDDTLLQIVIVIVDTAGVIASDALKITQTAAATDSKAQQVAKCAQTWSIVAAIVATIVVIVVAIVTTVFSFGGATGLVAVTVTAVAAIIGAILTVVQNLPTNAPTIQGIVYASISVIATLSNTAIPAADRDRLRRDTTDNLRGAMTMIQGNAAMQLPALSVDLNQSIAVSDQTSRALQKLLAYLRQRQPSGRLPVVVTELGQLVQTHSSLAALLRSKTTVAR